MKDIAVLDEAGAEVAVLQKTAHAENGEVKRKDLKSTENHKGSIVAGPLQVIAEDHLHQILQLFPLLHLPVTELMYYKK